MLFLLLLQPIIAVSLTEKMRGVVAGAILVPLPRPAVAGRIADKPVKAWQVEAANSRAVMTTRHLIIATKYNRHTRCGVHADKGNEPTTEAQQAQQTLIVQCCR